MTFSDDSLKHHDFLMTIDITQHILPSNSAKKCLINYSIFYNLKFSCTLRTYTQFIPHFSQSAQTLYYIILHYITLQYITIVFCNLHCIKQ